MSKTNIAISGGLGILAALLLAFGGFKALLVVAALICSALVVLLAYEKATYVITLYVFLDYILRTFAGGMAGNLWDEALFALMLVIWAYKWFVDHNNWEIRTTPLDGALILFYGVGFVLLFINSVDFSQSVEGLRAIVQHTLWYFPVVQLIKSEKDCRNIYKLLILVAFLLGLHGIYQYIIGVEMPPNWIDSVETGIRTRVYSIIGSPNILGSLMTLVVPLSVSMFFAEKKWQVKGVYLLAALVMSACLIFTFSRGAWIGFLAAVFAYVILKDRRLLLPALLGVLLVALLVPSVTNRLTYMLSPEYIESSLSGGRLVRWIEGVEMVRIRPFVGLGLGQFGGAVAVNNEVEEVFYMDNYYLKTAVEMGLIGLTAFIVLMYQVLAWSLRAASRIIDPYYKELAIGGLSGLFGIVIHNGVENVFEVPMMTAYFWVVAAVMMVLFTKLALKDKPSFI